MKVLFVGGTGNISSDCVAAAAAEGFAVSVLNRGSRPARLPDGVEQITADIRDPAQARKALADRSFDAVCEFIAFTPEQVRVDLDLFRGKTGQYIFISSASVYHKPPRHFVITESTPAYNPYWEYSQLKIQCEDVLNRAYAESGFPVTIVRPSHTYGVGWLPTTFGRDYTVAQRILDGKPVVVHGDGESLWTLTHTRDFAVAFTGLLGNPGAIGETFHITSDFVYTWNTIHRTIGQAVGAEPKIVHIPSDFIARVLPDRAAGLLGDKAHSVVFDNTKIKRLVPHFVAKIPLHRGMEMSVDWYERNPEKKVSDPAAEEEMEKLLSLWSKLG